MMKRAIIALLALLLLVAPATAGEGLEPDAEVQERLAEIVAAVVARVETTALVDGLRELQPDREAMLQQLALFLAASTSTEESMTGAAVLHDFDFTTDEKLRAVVPHLDVADPALRKVLEEILSTVDRPDGGEPDFGAYEEYLRSTPGQRPDGLILYMYRVAPVAAVESMHRIPRGVTGPAAMGEILELQEMVAKHPGVIAWSPEDRDAARQALDRLSRDSSPWVRLYVKATLEREPELATPALQERLAADPEPLVRP
jgi:hypothetical protein